MLSKFKNKSKNKGLKTGQNLKTASHNLKFTDSYKKRLNTLYKLTCGIILLSIVDKSDYIFRFFANSEQTRYFKIGKFCLFMMHRPKLNVKWQVTQTEGQSGLQRSSF